MPTQASKGAQADKAEASLPENIKIAATIAAQQRTIIPMWEPKKPESFAPRIPFIAISIIKTAPEVVPPDHGAFESGG